MIDFLQNSRKWSNTEKKATKHSSVPSLRYNWLVVWSTYFPRYIYIELGAAVEGQKVL